MHPAIILIPAAALVIGPRLWVNHVMQQHNKDDEDLDTTAAQLARELLDWHDLKNVNVEMTDLGDHYDPEARAVRLSRDKFDRKSLTAVATAAHEVSHALQHAAGYQPFVWRRRLARAAQVTGEAGFVLLMTIPIATLTGRQPLPPPQPPPPHPRRSFRPTCAGPAWQQRQPPASPCWATRCCGHGCSACSCVRSPTPSA